MGLVLIKLRKVPARHAALSLVDDFPDRGIENGKSGGWANQQLARIPEDRVALSIVLRPPVGSVVQPATGIARGLGACLWKQLTSFAACRRRSSGFVRQGLAMERRRCRVILEGTPYRYPVTTWKEAFLDPMISRRA